MYIMKNMINKRSTYKDPNEYLPSTFGMTIHYITHEKGLDVYEFDFLDIQGTSLWNCISKHSNYHDLMKTLLDIKRECRNDLLIMKL